LGKRTAVACSESRVEVAACSEAGDKAMVCYGARIKDGKRWWHDGF
jgi:hypothetical protein